MHKMTQKQRQFQKKNSANLIRLGQIPLKPGHNEHPILHLQHTIGNRAVRHLLTANKPEDNLQRSIASLQNGGRPFPSSERAFFESRFKTDFSCVRIHTDRHADELARNVNARAFTLGRNIVFGTGQYQPGSSDGQRLLAHELVHVVQQSNTSSPTPELSRISQPTDATEREADQVTNAVMSDRMAPVVQRVSPHVARDRAQVRIADSNPNISFSDSEEIDEHFFTIGRGGTLGINAQVTLNNSSTDQRSLQIQLGSRSTSREPEFIDYVQLNRGQTYAYSRSVEVTADRYRLVFACWSSGESDRFNISGSYFLG